MEVEKDVNSDDDKNTWLSYSRSFWPVRDL